MSHSRAIRHEQLDAGGAGRHPGGGPLHLRVRVVQPRGAQHEGGRVQTSHNAMLNVARLSGHTGPACGAITIPVWQNGQNYVTFFSRN